MTLTQPAPSNHSLAAASTHAVAVFGAAGHTGLFVVKELLRRGMRPVPICRTLTPAVAELQRQGVPIRLASLQEPASLDLALAGAQAVINCAGPFLDTANQVVAAALRAGIHYLDVTAEQASALATFETFAGAAQDAGVVVMPGMGFYGGFADLLATAAMGDWASADAIDIAIALDSWRPTQGTLNTGKRNTATRQTIRSGKLVPLVPATEPWPWDFAAPFGQQEMTEVPLAEMVLIARHLRVATVRNFLNNAPLRELNDPATPPPQPVDATGRSAQQFLVEVAVRKGADVRRMGARGQDIYAFTAPLVVEAASRILDGAIARHGVAAPGEVFDADSFLRALAPAHLALASNTGNAKAQRMGRVTPGSTHSTAG